MKIIKGIESYSQIKNLVVTIGTFDGVHVGHKRILERLKTVAKENKGESLVITFHPHPRKVIFPNEQDLMLINTLEEKLLLFAEEGIDNVLIIPFTLSFARKSSMDFVKEILAGKLGIKHIVIGYNHHFGFGRSGNFKELQEAGRRYGFDVEEIPQEVFDEVAISSTIIRKSLFCGNIEKANQFLGTPYFISGKIVEGMKIGRLLGFPTANIELPQPDKIIPPDGVYCVTVKISGKEYKGMLYIGNKPTFDSEKKVIEVNIFDFSENIYNKEIQITFFHHLRGDIRFDSKENLIKQIEADKQKTLEYFNEIQ